MAAALPELLLPLNQVGLLNLKRHTLHYFLWLQRRHLSPHGTDFHWKSQVAGGTLWLVDFSGTFSLIHFQLSSLAAISFSSNPTLLASKKPSASCCFFLITVEPEEGAMYSRITILGTTVVAESYKWPKGLFFTYDF